MSKMTHRNEARQIEVAVMKQGAYAQVTSVPGGYELTIWTRSHLLGTVSIHAGTYDSISEIVAAYPEYTSQIDTQAHAMSSR